MSCTACSVIQVDGNWVVECGKTRHGPYLSDGLAVRIAIAATPRATFKNFSSG